MGEPALSGGGQAKADIQSSNDKANKTKVGPVKIGKDGKNIELNLDIKGKQSQDETAIAGMASTLSAMNPPVANDNTQPIEPPTDNNEIIPDKSDLEDKQTSAPDTQRSSRPQQATNQEVGEPKPGEEGEQPKEGEPAKPSEEGEQPKEGEPAKPSEEGEQPKEGEEPKPGEEGEQPKEGEEPKPGEESEQPKEGEQPKPGEESEQPKEGEQPKPGEESEQPKEGEEPKPSEEGGQPKPSEESEQPREGEPVKPGEEGEQPKEGEKTPEAIAPNPSDTQEPAKLPDQASANEAQGDMSADKQKKNIAGGRMDDDESKSEGSGFGDKVGELGDRAGEWGKNKIQGGVDKLKQGAKNKLKGAVDGVTPNFIKNNKLKKEKRKLLKELAKLDKSFKGISGSKSFGIISFFMPGLGASVTSTMRQVSGMKGKMNKAILKTKITSLKTVTSTLEAVRTGASIVDANVSWWGSFTSTLPTIILPFLLIFLYIPFLLVYWIKGGTLSGAVKKVKQKFEKILKPLEAELKKETGKEQLRNKLKQIDLDLKYSQQQRNK